MHGALSLHHGFCHQKTLDFCHACAMHGTLSLHLGFCDQTLDFCHAYTNLAQCTVLSRCTMDSVPNPLGFCHAYTNLAQCTVLSRCTMDSFHNPLASAMHTPTLRNVRCSPCIMHSVTNPLDSCRASCKNMCMTIGSIRSLQQKCATFSRAVEAHNIAEDKAIPCVRPNTIPSRTFSFC
jgi:hypothetical protein